MVGDRIKGAVILFSSSEVNVNNLTLNSLHGFVHQPSLLLHTGITAKQCVDVEGLQSHMPL